MTRSIRSAVLALAAATALVVTATVSLAAPVQAATLPTIHGSWSAIPAFPSSVSAMTVTAGPDGRIYVFGFCQGSCAQVGGTVGFGAAVTEVYDPSARTWAPGRGAPAICAAAMASAVGSDGLIHLAGCWKDMVTAAGVRVAIYDPASASWSMQPGHGPLQRQGGAVFAVGYRVLIDAQGLWFSGLPVPNTAPSDAATLGHDGRIYAVGGSRNCQPEFGPCAVPPVQAYQPLTNAWRQVSSMPTPRIRVAAATDSRGRIFVMGGLAGDAHATYRAVQIYRPWSHSWAKAAPLPQARMAALATATPDGRVWLLGGYDSNGSPLSDGYVFTPTRQ